VIGHYQTARAVRAALEDRLKQTARAQGIDLMRLRRQVAFDRLLARLFAESEPGASDPPWLLKGGDAFELRLGAHARATKDVDLTVPAPSRPGANAGASPQAQNALIRERLQDAAEGDLHDGFAFRIGDPMADVDAAPYGGARYPIVAWRGSTIAPWRPFTWMWASATTSRRRLSGSPASISSTLPASRWCFGSWTSA